MAILDLVIYPDPVLRAVAQEVEEIDEEVLTLVSSMAETMYEYKGVGLAAPQVGVSRRIFVIDVSEPGEASELRVFINPKILTRSGSVIWNEGCLSFPGFFEEVEAVEELEVEALNERGEVFRLKASGLMAVAISHENDHLNGVVFIDRLSPVRRKLAERRWRNLQKRQ